MPDPVKAPPSEMVQKEQEKIIDTLFEKYHDKGVESLMTADLIGQLAYERAVIKFNLGEAR